MIQPKIVKKVGSIEVWRFRNQLFQALYFSDGVVQLRHCDEEGRTKEMFPLNSHNMHMRQQAVKWLNDNIG